MEEQLAGKVLEAPGARQGPLALSSYCSLPSPSGLLIDRIFEEQVSFKMSSAHNLIL